MKMEALVAAVPKAVAAPFTAGMRIALGEEPGRALGGEFGETLLTVTIGGALLEAAQSALTPPPDPAALDALLPAA